MSKIVKAFNKLVFLYPRRTDGTLTVGDIAFEIQKDFWETIKFFDSNINQEDLLLSNPSGPKSVIGYALWLINECIPSGDGFTPLLSVIKDEETFGYNCLGRAIALGTCLRFCKYNYDVHLGITPDHAMTIVKLRGSLYICDLNKQKLRKLHGTITKHPGYDWYTAVPEDDVIFSSMVIHDFDIGIINAIMGSLAFLREPPEEPSETDRERLVFNHKRFKLSMAIRSIDWASRQTVYFAQANAYKTDYRKEYLLGRVVLESRRHQQDMRNSFTEVARIAYQKATKMEYTPDNHKMFIEGHTPVFQQFGEKILAFLSGAVDRIDLPKTLSIYLHEFREHIKTNEELKEFSMDRFTLRCQVEQVP